MNWNQRATVVVIAVLYLVLAAMLLYLALSLAPWTPQDGYKNFSVLAGAFLAAESAFIGLIVSLFAMNTQIQAARQLENQKKEILKEVETLKGQIARESEFVRKALDVKSVAFDKLFVASNNCYRELQNLAKGQYDKARAAECERGLREAEGLSANLDDADREIVQTIVQNVLNIVDEAEAQQSRGDVLRKAYEDLWAKYAPSLGQAIEELRQRSLFRTAPVAAPGGSGQPASG